MSLASGVTAPDGGGGDGMDVMQSPHGSGPSANVSEPGAHRHHLLLYEAMVRHQDLEFDTTRDHIAMDVERIKRLGIPSGQGIQDMGDDGRETPPPEGMLTYIEIRRCLLRLGLTWERSLPPQSSGFRSYGEFAASCYDDDVSVAFAGGGPPAANGTPGTIATGTSSSAAEADVNAIAADAQLVLLLTTLVEMEERHRAEMLADDHDENYRDKNEALFARGLFLPEFVQAYRIVIGGMQAQQAFLGASEPAGALQEACAALGMPSDMDALQDLQYRSRERTMALLRLFGPDASVYRDELHAHHGTRDYAAFRDIWRDGLAMSANRRRAKIEGKEPVNEIRKLVHSKDEALARVVDEHEAEMDAVATSMEEMKLYAQKLLDKRRKRTGVIMIVYVVLFGWWGGLYEGHGRERIQLKIAGGAVAERWEHTETTLDWHNLTRESAVRKTSEDAIQRAESRSAHISKRHEEDVVKWLLDRQDLKECRASSGEINAELSAIRLQNEDLKKGVEWYRARLVSAEIAMEGIRQVSRKGSGLANHNFSLAEVAEAAPSNSSTSTGIEEMGMHEDKASRTSGGVWVEGGMMLKPVNIEMKQNRLFRKFQMKRLIYVALGGTGISTVAGVIANVFRLLFLG